MTPEEKELKYPKLGQFSADAHETPAEYTAWSVAKDQPTKDALMGYLKPTISSAVSAYGGGDDSLKVRSNIIADQAIRSWDPTKGTLKTHVFNHLKGLQRYRTRRQYAVHAPERKRLDSFKVSRFEKDFRSKHDRDPSDQEIGDGVHLSLKRIQESRINPEVSSSQGTSDKGDLMAGQGRTYEDIWKDYVYHDLNTQNKRIFEWVTGHNGKKKLSKMDIANKLRISPAAVSQRINTIQKRLESGFKDDGSSLM